MMQASKMFPCSSGASWLWWAWTAVPCSPDQATTGTRQIRCWELSCGLAGLGWHPSRGRQGRTKINRRPDDRQNFHSLSPPGPDQRESFESVLVPVSEFS